VKGWKYIKGIEEYEKGWRYMKGIKEYKKEWNWRYMRRDEGIRDGMEV